MPPNGEGKYVTDGMLHVRPYSVVDVLEELAASAHEDEAQDGEPESESEERSAPSM